MGRETSLFLPLSPPRSLSLSLLTHSLGLFAICSLGKPAPPLRVALCRFSPPTWLHQSLYPALRPFLTQCLLLSQGPGIWGGGPLSLFLSLSVGVN